MLKIFYSSCNTLNRRLLGTIIKRNFLSNAYKCSEVWNNRLKSGLLQNLDPENIYYQLNLIIKKKDRVNVLDVDLLCSGLKDFNLKPEVEDLLYNLRQWPECGILPERATHAVIRLYLEHCTPPEIFDVLSDRLNYGLFPDSYLTNLFLDKFLKDQDEVSAVKIAVLQMLQEDFSNDITKPLALHSCFKYLNSPNIWPSLKEEKPDPDEEVIKVRVELVRKPYFDDHFDIVNTNHLVGKTLWLFGRTVDNSVGLSSQLVGLVLYEKYTKAVSLLENIIKNNAKIHAEAVQKAKEYALKTPKEEQPEVTEPPKEEAGAESQKNEEKKEDSDPIKSKFLLLLEKIDKKNLIEKDLLTETEALVKEAVSKYEKQQIDHQCQVYQNWEEEREQHAESEIKRCEKEKIMAQIDKDLTELKSEEEKIFYFDREDEMEEIAEEVAIKEKNIEVYKYTRADHKLLHKKEETKSK